MENPSLLPWRSRRSRNGTVYFIEKRCVNCDLCEKSCPRFVIFCFLEAAEEKLGVAKERGVL